jgi:glyoxylase-like metal-dependent hydrolase (beta-lactamase superfamily II)
VAAVPGVAAGPPVAEVAPGVHRMALPLGIHGVPTVSAYLLRDGAGDTLVDCGIAAAGPAPAPPPTPAARSTPPCARPGARWSASPGWS